MSAERAVAPVLAGAPPSATRRRLVAAGGAALAMPALVGCSRRGEAPLRFWALGREGEVLPALLAPLTAEVPSLEVRVEAVPFSAAHEKLLTAYAGEATPDLAQVGNTWMPEFAAIEALAPLDAAAAAAGIASDDHFDGIWRTNVVGGRLLGVPWYVDTRLVFHRRDLFERAGVARFPADWAGWTAALDSLQAHGLPHPLLLPLDEPEPLLALALQQPEPLLREGDRYGNFSGPGFRRAIDFYLERFARGHAQRLAGARIGNLWQEFGRGSFAAFVSGPWNIGELDRRLPAAMRAAWSTAPLPGPQGPGASTAGGSSLVVFRKSRRFDDAMRVIAYLARPEVQLRFHALTGNLPPRRSTWALPPLATDARSAAFADQLERARPTPAVPEWERIAQEMQLHAARALDRGTSIEEATAALDARVDGFLEKRRWMLARADHAHLEIRGSAR